MNTSLIKTTMIGSYPKPDYVKLPDWFKISADKHNTDIVNDYLKNVDEAKAEENFSKAIHEIVEEQTSLGIDVITDGEMRREKLYT